MGEVTPLSALVRPHDHVVQFYGDEDRLSRVVTDFLAGGLEAGDALVVIATEAHRATFWRELSARGLDVESASAGGQLRFLDARATLETFMVGGMPDWHAFLRNVGGGVLEKVGAAGGPRPIRAYGEMVDVLWREGHRSAAVHLEGFWNELGKRYSFSILCAYVSGNFYRDSHGHEFRQICGVHSRILAEESKVDAQDPIELPRQVALLEQRALALETELQDRKRVENTLRIALDDRRRAEEEARLRYEFGQQLIGIVSHDLRNPIHAIAMSASLARKRTTDECLTQALSRITASAERAARIIADLLDLTQARLGVGIPIRPRPTNIHEIVHAVVEEQFVAQPDRELTFESEGDGEGEWDSERLQQAVSNLLSNAIQYSPLGTPVRITTRGRERDVAVSVHNQGDPIPEPDLPEIFQPFKRANGKRATKGLGLGLYIVERIVSSHGGAVHCQSKAFEGTTFHIVLPRRPTPRDRDQDLAP
jgi:signal transduction histidine kinase